MAISVIGTATFGYTNTAGGDTIALPLAWNLQQDDIVLVGLVSGDLIHDNSTVAMTGYNTLAGVYADGTFDVNLITYYKRMSATPDSSFVTPSLSGSRWSGIVYALRGVDPTTALDVAVTTATGVGDNLPNPPAITPTSVGTKVVAFWGAATNTSWSVPAGTTDFVQFGASSGHIGGATYNWTSGSINPDTATGDSGIVRKTTGWGGITIAFRAAHTIYNINSNIGGVGGMPTASLGIVNKTSATLTATALCNPDLQLITTRTLASLTTSSSLSSSIKLFDRCATSLNGVGALTSSLELIASLKVFSYTKPQTGINTYSVGITVKKDNVGRATRNGLLRVTGGGGVTKVCDIQFDTATGEYSTTTNNNWIEAGVYDSGQDWFVWGTFTTNSDNTNVQVDFSPCAGINFVITPSASGTMYFKEPVITLGNKYALGREVVIAILNEYTDNLVALDQAISTEDAKSAEWTNISSTPANLLTLTGNEVLDNAQILASIANDDVISIQEKYNLAKIYSDYEGRYNDTVARAATLGLSTVAVSNARTSFINLLTSYSPAWNDTSQDTVIFTSAFSDKSFTDNWTPSNLEITPNGLYTTLNDTGGSLGMLYRSKSQVGANIYSASVLIKKDTVQPTTRFPVLRINCTGGTAKVAAVGLNTATGSNVNIANCTAFGVLDLGDSWLLYLTTTANSNNTSVAVEVFPAYGANNNLTTASNAAIGSIDARAAVLTNGAANTLGHSYLNGIVNRYAAEIQKLWSTISGTDSSIANYVDGPTSATVNYDSTGTTIEDSVDLPFYLRSGVDGVVVTSGVTMTYSILSGTINGFNSTSGAKPITVSNGVGTLTISSMTTDTAQLKISVTSTGITRTYFCVITRILAAQASTTGTGGGGTGGTGGTAASQTSGFLTFNSSFSTYHTISDTLNFTTGSSQTSVTAKIILSPKMARSSVEYGPWNVGYKWQRLISGTWTDQGTVQNSNPDPYIEEDFDTGTTISNAGSINSTQTLTGLTANTAYSFRVVCALTSGVVPASGPTFSQTVPTNGGVFLS